MALTATIFKAELTLSDMDRDYYATHNLTVALHPSETESRMMLRLLAFALNANEDLAFSKGISNPEEPDLWQHHPNGTSHTGLILACRMRNACARHAAMLNASPCTVMALAHRKYGGMASRTRYSVSTIFPSYMLITTVKLHWKDV